MTDYLNLESAAPATQPDASGGDWLSGSFEDDPMIVEQPMYGDDMQAAPAPYATNPTMGVPTGSMSLQPPMLDDISPVMGVIGGARTDITNLVLDVEVPVEVYFGDAALTVEQFLDLGAGSVVELDHAIDAPIELRVRGRLVARGQLVTINGSYGLRITSMVE